MIVLTMIIIFIILLFSGMPVAFAMAISGFLAINKLGNVSLVLIPQRMFMSLNSFTLVAIPFFILAGELMNRGGITRRIVDFSKVTVGYLVAGLGQTTVITNIIMAGFSGSATADAVATGTILIPAMKEEGYPAGFAAGITGASSCIGPIIPPSLTMIIYAGITGVSTGKLFAGGIIPGLLIGFAIMAIVSFYGHKYNLPRGEKPTICKLVSVLKESYLALLAPIIILGGIITGITTAAEAGVIACLYAFILTFFVYREIKLRQIREILYTAALNTAIPVIIISCASVFGWVLAQQNFSSLVVNTMANISTDPYIIILLVIIMLLIIGLFVEGTAALIIFTPVLFPIGDQMGFDPIHFALIICITILIGTITPPVGLQLYVVASIAKVKINKVIIWPFVIAMIIALLTVAYIPGLITYLPSHLFK